MSRCDGALDMLSLMFGVKPFGGQNSCKIEKKMKIKEYREKQVKYDPIAWSKCNICHQKYPNDEIVQHIHQKHPEKDCSTNSCWTCGIKFRKETAMKCHMKTVKHQLEAKKYLITEESMEKTEVQVILIEADLLNEIQIENTPDSDNRSTD